MAKIAACSSLAPLFFAATFLEGAFPEAFLTCSALRLAQLAFLRAAADMRGLLRSLRPGSSLASSSSGSQSSAEFGNLRIDRGLRGFKSFDGEFD